MDIAGAMGATSATSSLSNSIRGLGERKALDVERNRNALKLKQEKEEYDAGEVLTPVEVKINKFIDGGIGSPQGQFVLRLIENGGFKTPEGHIKQKHWDYAIGSIETIPFLKDGYLSEKALGSKIKYDKAISVKNDPKAIKEFCQQYNMKPDSFPALLEQAEKIYLDDLNKAETMKQILIKLTALAEKEQADAEKAKFELEEKKSGGKWEPRTKEEAFEFKAAGKEPQGTLTENQVAQSLLDLASGMGGDEGFDKNYARIYGSYRKKIASGKTREKAYNEVLQETTGTTPKPTDKPDGYKYLWEK